MKVEVPSNAARVEPAVALLDYQRADVESPARFRWNCWARQTGKSFTKSLRRVMRGLDRRRNQIFLSAGERQSRELMDKARQHCQTLQIACEYHEREYLNDLGIRQLEIVLPGGVRVIGLPANPLTARGYTGDVLLDEFAMHVQDREIWASILPTVLRGDGEVDIASTPHGRGNLFYELQSNAQFSTSMLTLPQAIAQGLDVDADEMRRAIGDEELYRQEFLCEFLDESTAFLTYEQIAACMDPAMTVHRSLPALSAEQRELFAGVDVGRLRDLTVIWVLASEWGMLNSERGMDSSRDPAFRIPHSTLSTVAVIELSQAPFREQFDQLSQLLALRSVRRCCIDAGGLGMQLAEQCVEHFGAHRVEPIVFTAALKSQLASSLRIAVEGRRIRIPLDERIRNDWHSLERSVTQSGHFRLSAPRREGSHADRFWAAALALHAADGATGGVEHMAARPMQFARPGTW
jgi:phage FluMu gp28-like protein